MKNPPVLMVGLMMSFKTLWNIPSKWDPVFPLKERLDNIFPEYDYGTLNTLHYADFENPENWPEEKNLFYSLSKAMSYARGNLHAVQLDMTWPDPGMIASAVHASRHVVQVILQIGRKALEQADRNPKEVVSMLEDYTNVIDGVLLDQSMGEGKLMDPNLLLSYAEAISVAHPSLHIAVAGGLEPKNVEVLEPLLERFPNLSIDTQAGLRPDKNIMKPISWRMAEAYLERTGALFKRYEK